MFVSRERTLNIYYVSIILYIWSVFRASVLANTLPSGQWPVCGVIVMFDHVFVERQKTPDGPEVPVYDSKTFHLRSRLPVDRLVNPLDLTSCSKFRCLHIADCQVTTYGFKRLLYSGTEESWVIKCLHHPPFWHPLHRYSNSNSWYCCTPSDNWETFLIQILIPGSHSCNLFLGSSSPSI